MTEQPLGDMHMCDCEYCHWCGDESPEEPGLREALIKAAKEWFDWQDKAGHSHEEVDDALFAAVRALVTAEKSHE